MPEPFKLHVSDEDIRRLQEKLALATFPDEIESPNQWNYGTPLGEVKRLTEYWQKKYDWRKAEDEINQLPNFTTKIEVDGFGPIDIHYVYQPSSVNTAIPLLFAHGWPGSFLEVKKILPLLNGNDTSPAFHLVAPSLPNFGFSGGMTKPGFALEQYAEVCHKLMLQLGFKEYVTQGGDWGFYITRTMGILYPDAVKASHINMVRSNPVKFTKNPILALRHAITPYSRKEKLGIERGKWFLEEGSGYRSIQSSKPQTIGYALADSPVALLAWIYEKLRDWTDAYPWTDDEVLTWISIYWFSTAGPAASVRIYYEAVHASPPATTRDRTLKHIARVKLGMSFFPKELSIPPRMWSRTLGPVVFESEKEQGGHFAAWECPEEIVGDLIKMFEKGGSCFNIVKGHNGYESN